jgi:hypothetical protein
MTAPYLSGPWYPPLYAGHREGPDRDNLRPCGCPSDPLVFGHQVRHVAPVACGESGLNPETSSDEKGAAA